MGEANSMAIQENVATLVGTVWMVVCFPVFLTMHYLLYHNGLVYNLKVRGPYMMQVLNVVYELFFAYSALNNLIVLANPDACYSGVGFPLFTSLVALMVSLSCFELVFRFRIAAKLNSFKNSGSNNLDGLLKGEDSWFVRNRRFITRRYMVLFSAVMLVFLGLWVLPVVFVSSKCEDQKFAVSCFLGGVVILFLTIFIKLTRKLKAEDQEVFNIRKEMRYGAVFAVFFCVVASVMVFVLPDTNAGKATTNSVICAGVIFVWGTMVVWPVYIAHHADQGTDVSFQGVDRVATLSDLLTIQIGYESFLSYAKLEFAQENVLFWRAYDDFKKKFADSTKMLLNRRECLAEARSIIQSYISENAPSQVNLPAQVRNGVLQHFAHQDRSTLLAKNGGASAAVNGGTAAAAAATATHTSTTTEDSTNHNGTSGSSASTALIGPTSSQNNNAFTNEIDLVQMFEPAAEEIYKLMVTDILPRYIRSEQFAQFVIRMKELAEEMKEKHSKTEKHSRTDRPDKHSEKHSKGDHHKKSKKDKESKREKDDSKHSRSDNPVLVHDPTLPGNGSVPTNKNTYMSLTVADEEDEHADAQPSSTQSWVSGDAVAGATSSSPSATVPAGSNGVQLTRLPTKSQIDGAGGTPNTPKAPRITSNLRVDLSLGTNAAKSTLVDINEIVVDSAGIHAVPSGTLSSSTSSLIGSTSGHHH